MTLHPHLTATLLLLTSGAVIVPFDTSPVILAQSSEPQSITLQFSARVGDQGFQCGEHYPLGSPQEMMVPTDFRFYVSDVALIDANGTVVPLTLEQDGRWQYQNVALLDFEDKSASCVNGTMERRDRVVGTVPPGEYRGLQFTLGVPFALNHEDATLAPSPLNLTSLWWNWLGGYKFLRVDLNPMMSMGREPTPSVRQRHNPGGHGGSGGQGEHGGHDPVGTGFAIHLGSTACQAGASAQQPTPCGNPNTTTVVFEEFDPTQQVVVADLAALVATTPLALNQPGTPPGCMSSPDDGDCAGIMSALGLPFNGTAPTGQTFFRVE